MMIPITVLACITYSPSRRPGRLTELFVCRGYYHWFV